MNRFADCCLACIFACGLFALAPSGFAEESSEDLVRAKFELARKNFQTEIEKFNDSVKELMEKKVTVARKTGNKPVVDGLNVELNAFIRDETVPANIPVSFQRKQSSIRSKLADAYEVAIKEYTKRGADAEAKQMVDALKAHQQFDELAAIRKLLIGTWNLKLGSYTSNLIFHADGTVTHTTEKKTFKWVIDLGAGQVKCDDGNEGRGDIIKLPLNDKGTTGLNWHGHEFVLTKQK